MSALPISVRARDASLRIAPVAIPVALLFGLWQLTADVLVSQMNLLPAPTAVARQLWVDRSLYPGAVEATARNAALGYLWGTLIAIVLAVLFVQIPLVEGVLTNVAVFAYSMPIIALGPILQIVLGENSSKVAIAALLVFFPTLIAALIGLRSADASSLDIVSAYGGGSIARLLRVRVWAALPSLLAGLRIAAPTAVLGAIIGEYFGAEQGLGVAMVNAQATLDANRTWGIAVVATALSGAAYACVYLAGRLLVPWEQEVRL